jgi:hypothetical protein
VREQRAYCYPAPEGPVPRSALKSGDHGGEGAVIPPQEYHGDTIRFREVPWNLPAMFRTWPVE